MKRGVRIANARRVHVAAWTEHPRLIGVRAGSAGLCGAGMGYPTPRHPTDDAATCERCLRLVAAVASEGPKLEG